MSANVFDVADESDPTTQRLRVEQVQRELRERREAGEASDEDAAAQHERRADKSAYLREKLADRVHAEEDAAQPGPGQA